MIITSDGIQKAKQELEDALGIPGYVQDVEYSVVGRIVEVDDAEYAVVAATLEDGKLNIVLTPWQHAVIVNIVVES